jgi:hypothetical protein
MHRKGQKATERDHDKPTCQRSSCLAGATHGWRCATDGRVQVMAITVEDFNFTEAEGSSGSYEGRGFLSNLPDDT